MNCTVFQELTFQSFVWIISEVNRERQRLGRNNKSKLQNFLEKPAALQYKPPSSPRKRSATQRIADPREPKKPLFDAIPEQVVALCSKDLTAELSNLQMKVANQQQELNEVKRENIMLRSKVNSTAVKRVNQMLKRKNNKIADLKMKIKLLEELCDQQNIGKIQQQMEEQWKALQKAKDVKRKQKSRQQMMKKAATSSKVSALHVKALKTATARLHTVENELIELQETSAGTEQDTPTVATVDKTESKIMYSANQTAEWLDQKSPEARSTLIEMACKEGSHVRKQEMDRRRNQQALQEKLRAKRVQLGEQEERKRNVTEKLIEDILEYGLWDSDGMEAKLNRLKSVTKKKQGLKVQINMFHKVIGVPSKIALTKSTIDQMKDHLVTLLQQPLTESQQNLIQILKEPDSLVGKTVDHTWTVDQQLVVYRGEVLEHLKASNEFKVKCDQEPEPYYITRSEAITDIVRGDMNIVYPLLDC